MRYKLLFEAAWMILNSAAAGIVLAKGPEDGSQLPTVLFLVFAAGMLAGDMLATLGDMAACRRECKALRDLYAATCGLRTQTGRWIQYVRIERKDDKTHDRDNDSVLGPLLIKD